MRRTIPAALVIALALTAPACGGDSKQKALKTSLSALNAARDGFIAWDKNHQDKIVAGATSLDDGKVKLDRYRKTREPVLQGFTVAYSALAAAALSPSVAMILEASKAATGLYALIRGFGADEKVE